jgi:hypothetical protein
MAIAYLHSVLFEHSVHACDQILSEGMDVFPRVRRVEPSVQVKERKIMLDNILFSHLQAFMLAPLYVRSLSDTEQTALK